MSVKTVLINIQSLIMFVFPAKLIHVSLVVVVIIVLNVQETCKLILKEINVLHVQTLIVMYVQTIMFVLLALKDLNLT